MWLKKLKIALIQKDITQLEKLVEHLPHLEKSEEIDEALHLLEAATSLITQLRDETQTSMIQMKKNIDFLKSTQAPLVSKLDINF